MDVFLFFNGLADLLIDSAVKATILLVLIGGIGWIWAREKPVWAGLLGTTALFGLLILPLVSVLLPGLEVPSLSRGEERPVQGVAAAPVPSSLAAQSSASVPLLEESSAVEEEVHPSWTLIVAGLYLMGLLFALLRLGAALWRVSEMRRKTQVLAETPALERWRWQLGIKRPVELGISNTVTTPTVIGFWRPLIIIPGSIYAQGNRAHLDSIIVHELAHIKRWDFALNFLSLMAAALYWYHPFVYLAQRTLAQVREQVCDDWVLETVGDARSYASTLLEVKGSARPFFTSELRLDMARSSNVAERVERITRPGKSTSPRLNWLAAGPAIVVVLGLGVLLGCADFGSTDTVTPTEQADQLFVIQQDRKYGYIDITGELVIEPRFEAAYDFNEGLSGVRLEGKWGFIDQSGAFVIEPRFERVWYAFSEGLCGVRLEGKWGFIDQSGERVIEPLYEEVGHFSEGLAAVRKGGKWGFVDREGKMVIEPKLEAEYQREFKNGLAPIQSKAGFKGYIDRSGTVVWGAPMPSDELPFYFVAEGLKNVVINPAGTNAERFMTFDAELGLAGKTEEGMMTAGEIGENAIVLERINTYIPRIKSVMVEVLRSKTIDQLQGENFENVKTEIERGLNQEIFQKLFRMSDDKMEILVQEVKALVQ
jgi:beta-lactamase regulating signal transducer with metallopeptidase domain